MIIQSCTGLQDNEKDLKEFLKEHPEFDEDIFGDLDETYED